MGHFYTKLGGSVKLWDYDGHTWTKLEAVL